MDKWVDAEINKLHSYMEKGTPVTEIADSLERSEASVLGYCYRNRIALPEKPRNVKWSDAEFYRLCAYIEDGVPIKFIAKLLGRSEASVWSCCYRNHILERPGNVRI